MCLYKKYKVFVKDQLKDWYIRKKRSILNNNLELYSKKPHLPLGDGMNCYFLKLDAPDPEVANLRFWRFIILTIDVKNNYNYGIRSSYKIFYHIILTCKYRHPEMKDLKNKELICSCGNRIDRDYNAAINILKNAK